MRTGNTILVAFALIWIGIAAFWSGYGSFALYGAALAVSGLVLYATWRRPEPKISSEAEARIGRVVGIASAGEGIAIPIAAIVLANLGLGAYVVDAVALIVGLHFLALAYWMPLRLYYATGAVMIGIAVSGLWIGDPALRVFTVAAVCACMLWASAIVRLFHAPHRAVAAEAR